MWLLENLILLVWLALYFCSTALLGSADCRTKFKSEAPAAPLLAQAAHPGASQAALVFETAEHSTLVCLGAMATFRGENGNSVFFLLAYKNKNT